MVKRTLQEIANFFDMAVAVDKDGCIYMHPIMPIRSSHNWYNHGDDIFTVDSDIVDYSGDWRDSLTLPDSWPKEPPFKFGELVASKGSEKIFAQWGKNVTNKNIWRRLTEAEWKVLKGEE